MAPFPPTLAGSSQKRTAHKRASPPSKVQHRDVPAHVPAAGGVGGGGQWDDDDDLTVEYCVGFANAVLGFGWTGSGGRTLLSWRGR
mmetsp:Transcript_20198/g.42089  ORF Transcript_20198/g.42089 Transcript_20198/m.42089 type:complete len:86 (+) Transcript_20198:158-415(+)